MCRVNPETCSGRLVNLDPSDEHALYSMEMNHPVKYLHTAVVLRKCIGVALRKSRTNPTEIPSPISQLRRMWCTAIRLQHFGDDDDVFTMLDCDVCDTDSAGCIECSLCGTTYHPACVCASFARLSERVGALPASPLPWADLPDVFCEAAALCVFCKNRFKDRLCSSRHASGRFRIDSNVVMFNFFTARRW